MARLTSEELIRDPIENYPSATVACFDATTGDLPRRRLDASRNVAYLERLSRAGTPAVLIGASTGQGHLRTPEELREWFEVAARANIGETLRIALLRPEDGDEVNQGLLDALANLDYTAVFVRPGTNLSKDAGDEQVFENMRPLVQGAADRGFAVGLYSISDVSGLPLAPSAAARLVDGPGGDRICAIKVTEADYADSTIKFLNHPDLTHLKIVEGWDPHLAQAIQDGPRFDAERAQRCGVTSGAMSFGVYQYTHMLTAAEAEDWDELERAQQAVTTVFASLQDDPKHFADLQRAKYVMGLGHPLTGEVTQEQAERLLKALEGLPRRDDRTRLARSLDLMGDGPLHKRLLGIH